jgi:hypothetical protein
VSVSSLNLSRRAVPEKSDYHVFFALHDTQCYYK